MDVRLSAYPFPSVATLPEADHRRIIEGRRACAQGLFGCLSSAVVLFAGTVLTACPGPKTTPTPIPATATPTAIPATPTPDGWVQHQSGDVTISLPRDWDVLELGKADLQTVFAEFQQSNPELAKVIGSADALQGVALWAFRTGDGERRVRGQPQHPAQRARRAEDRVRCRMWSTRWSISTGSSASR